MAATEELSGQVGVAPACEALGVSRATFYRRRRGRRTPAAARPVRPESPRALTETERKAAIEVLHSDRFVDTAPAAICATLLDEGRYLCSPRTFYRLLAARGEGRERRNQLRHPVYTKPELEATAPNHVWTWDITKLLGPVKWTYFYLYVLLDLFSRYVVGWMVAPEESARLAARLIKDASTKHAIAPGQLTTHSDRGSPMISKAVEQLLADLSIGRSFSRPRVSNDNAFSEAQFKTLKYRPGFPERFGSLQDARAFCRGFFRWYNEEHRHSGIGYLTPATVHFGRTGLVTAVRQRTLDAAYAAHPERFVRRPPVAAVLPPAVWINKREDVQVVVQ